MNVGAGDPVQLPGEAVNVCPSTSEPLIVGGELFAGGLVADCTTAVAFEETGPAEPEPLLPVTATTSVEPISAGASWYVDEVAPRIGLQLAPLLSQRCH